MFKHIFGNTFDFNNDGKKDSLEQRAEYQAIMNEVRMGEAIEKPLSEMSHSELADIASKTGVDPGWSGF